MSTYEEYIRFKTLKEFYDGLTEEQKKALTVPERLDSIERKVERNKYSFWTDVGANVAGNALWDVPVWLLSKVVKRIRL